MEGFIAAFLVSVGASVVGNYIYDRMRKWLDSNG